MLRKRFRHACFHFHFICRFEAPVKGIVVLMYLRISDNCHLTLAKLTLSGRGALGAEELRKAGHANSRGQ